MGKSSGNGENFGNWFDFYLTQGRAREDAVPLPPLAVFPRVFQDWRREIGSEKGLYTDIFNLGRFRDRWKRWGVLKYWWGMANLMWDAFGGECLWVDTHERYGSHLNFGSVFTAQLWPFSDASKILSISLISTHCKCFCVMQFNKQHTFEQFSLMFLLTYVEILFCFN